MGGSGTSGEHGAAQAGARPIPLVDLRAAHAEVDEEVREGLDRVLASAAYIKGPEVTAFEREYAAFSGVRHCVGTANGTCTARSAS